MTYNVASSAGINVGDPITVSGNSNQFLNGPATVSAVASGQVMVRDPPHDRGQTGTGGTLTDNGVQSVFSLCYDFHLHVAVSSGPCSFGANTSGDNGNVYQILNNVDSTRSAAFTYDSLNRISQANTINATSANCWGETYTIDTWGNLTNRGAPSGMSGSCKTDGLSATATTQNQLGGIALVYDPAGNVVNDGMGHTPTYDAENRIVTNAGVNYYYDADGVRINKSSGTMYWPGPSAETLTETSLAGTIDEEYVYFNGERIARVDSPGGTVNYYFSNHLGSASVIATAAGDISEQTDYYPFGGIAYTSGSDPNHYQFTGKERDAESGLDYFGARHYASSLGRYMRPDDPFADQHPGDPQSWNLYSYVRNNPLNATDPSGHECVSNSSGGWEWSGSGETCEDVDAQNQEYKQSGQASATVNGCEGEGAADCLGAMVSDLTSTSSLSEVGVNGILGAQAAEGLWELPGALRSGWGLISDWRMASRMAGVRAAGEAVELAAGIVKNTERITSSTGSAAYRVPDILDHANKVIGEVKNYTTTTVNLTNQLKDDLAYASANGYTMELRVRQGAQLSQSVQQLVDQGKITLTRF